MKIARITTVQAGLKAGAGVVLAGLKGRQAVLGLMAVLVLSSGAEALDINPTFTDGYGETWDSTRQGVINEAIAEWESSILESGTVNVTFEFSQDGPGGYLGMWGVTISAYEGDNIYPWTSGVSHTIYFNVDLFGGTPYLWWDPTPDTSDDQPFFAWDALSVARHEIAHVMGFAEGVYFDNFGPSQHDRWTDQIDGTTFDLGGLNVSMASAGNLSHVAGSASDPDADLMVTSIANNIRRPISQMDREMLALAHDYTVIAGVPGDVDGNGWVGDGDLSIVIDNWGQSLGREFGDLNGNGIVDGPDYAEVLSYWNPQPPEPPSEAVPEAATLGLMLIGGLVLLRRRREA